jgi:hypothetical protein
MVQGDGAGAKENKRKSECGHGKRKLESAIASQAIVQMHFPNGDRKIDANGEGGNTRKEAGKDEQSTEELREGGKIGHPGGQTEAAYELGVMMKASENFVVAVRDHDGAESKAQYQKCERLQTIQVAQTFLRGKENRLQEAEGMQKWVSSQIAGSRSAALVLQRLLTHVGDGDNLARSRFPPGGSGQSRNKCVDENGGCHEQFLVAIFHSRWPALRTAFGGDGTAEKESRGAEL